MKNLKLIILLVIFSTISACTQPSKLTDGNKTEKMGFDKNEIPKKFKANKKNISKCYKKSLKEETNLNGIMLLDFDIQENGSVTNVSIDKKKSTLKDQNLASCVSSEIKQWQFPKHTMGKLNIKYPLSFNSKKK